MKKKWFYLAASVILAGCAEDAFDNGLLQDTEIPQEIKLSVGTARAEVTTRGAGSIGDLDNNTSTNVWSGQNLIIWAFHKKASSLATNDAQNVYLRGDSAVADGGNNVTLTWKDETSRYYPLQGAFHFAGYYIDDAKQGEAIQTENNIVQNVKIDGSQDIMIAQAELKLGDKKKLINSLISYGKLTGTVAEYLNDNDSILSHKDTILAEYDKAYSSYTARREIQPNMIFKHQLARLKFSVTAGDDNSVGGSSHSIMIDTINKNLARGVLIKSIKLKNAQTQGVITMALPTTDNDPIITFKPASGEKSGVLTLQEKKDGNTTLTELTPKAPESKDNYTPIGESILAFPEDKYLIDVETIQYLQKKDNAYEAVKDSTGIINTYQDVTIELMKDENGQPVQFKAGYTYDIKVKVYSNQEISITATLEGWKPGGDIVISPEDDIFDQDHNSGNNAGNN